MLEPVSMVESSRHDQHISTIRSSRTKYYYYLWGDLLAVVETCLNMTESTSCYYVWSFVIVFLSRFVSINIIIDRLQTGHKPHLTKTVKWKIKDKNDHKIKCKLLLIIFNDIKTVSSSPSHLYFLINNIQKVCNTKTQWHCLSESTRR